jgi:hypothetical protein
MFGGEGNLLVLVVAIHTEFFRLFFAVYLIEALVNIVMGEGGGRLLGRPEQDNQNDQADCDKSNIQQVFSGYYLGEAHKKNSTIMS